MVSLSMYSRSEAVYKPDNDNVLLNSLLLRPHDI